MDPNSQHQLWSKWTFYVAPGLKRPDIDTVRIAAWRFAKLVFGTTGQMRVEPAHVRRLDGQIVNGVMVELMVEGHPSHDREFVNAMVRRWTGQFFLVGYGNGTYVDAKVRTLAGDQQDGKPRDQMIIMPTLNVTLSGVEQ